MFTLAIFILAMSTMTDAHPLVCRFGALGDMVLLTPLLQQLYLRSGLPCDIVGVGGWNRSLFAEMPWVRNVYSIDSRSAPYWFNRSQRELVQVIQGFADQGLANQAADISPDIRHITVQQAFVGWCDASLEQSS